MRCIVHDLQGRIVRTLLDGTLEAGEHAIAFDGRGEDGRRVRPGLYLVRCIGPGLDRTRTLVMLQ